MVAALEVETRQLCQQPLLFLWAPGRLYRDAAFATKPGEEGPWKELDYDLMGLRDEEAPEPRVSRVVRWIYAAKAELKREVFELRQSKKARFDPSAQ